MLHFNGREAKFGVYIGRVAHKMNAQINGVIQWNCRPSGQPSSHQEVTKRDGRFGHFMLKSQREQYWLCVSMQKQRNQVNPEVGKVTIRPHVNPQADVSARA